jgi:aminopeptidase N/ABC-type transport system involved in multi-copper enzyme maturation permease subunit
VLRAVAAFELRYQLKSPVFWVGCLIFFLLTFGSITVDQVQIGSRGNVHVNAPFAILQVTAIMTLFATFVIVALVANVVLRDDETGFAPIIRATRVSKRDYLIGRYVGATLAAFMLLAVMPLAIMAGAAMPWLDPEKVGPFRLWDYGYALFFFALPTLLIVSAICFSLATATRSLMWTYVGAVALLVGYLVTRGLLRDPQHDTLVALADPFGLGTLAIVTKYWTAAERNGQLPGIAGVLLVNRALWLATGVALFAFAYARFSMTQAGASATRAGRRKTQATDAAPPRLAGRSATVPAPGMKTRWRQLWRLARFDMAFVFRSPAFFVLLGIGMLNSFGAMWYAGQFYGGEVYPVTRLMVNALNGAFTIIPIIVAIYYAGELVWRDRDRRVHEIVDATPAPDWAFLVPKIVAITLVLVATLLVGMTSGVLVQALKGYARFELLNYLRWFVLPGAALAVLFAVLSVFVQVLVPHKFLGWAVMLLYLVATVALQNIGFEHNLYLYAGTPDVPLSDMNGTGRFALGRNAFLLYWGLVALMLAVFSYGLWVRGASAPLRARLARLPLRLRGAPAVVLGMAAVAAAGVGGWIYYNTNVLNEYVTAGEREARLAALEKALLGYEKVPQPTIVDIRLAVDLFPREARAVTRGEYLLENRTGMPLDAVHVRWPQRLKMDTLVLPGATPAREYAEHAYRIYRLEPPMAPGERRVMMFGTTLEQRGFGNDRPLTRIVENGTFIDNTEITPSLGMSRDGLLQERAKRRKHGLEPELRPARLEDDSARAHNPLRGDADWVTGEITVTTDADQTPVAPGTTVSDTTANGRRTVRFRTDAPIIPFFSVQSARYAVQRDRWKDVELAVYYHPAHEYNVGRMLDAMKLSLDIFSERFSPFQFRQARILEFPGYASFAQSFANTIPYSETIGFIFNHAASPEKIDMVTYVTAHEIAHQWWAHQVIPSDQQGATMLVESLAQYSALLVMEQMYGRDQVRRFLKYELDRYLRSRGGEVVEELPLARVENQQYIHYQKGTLAMYWLREVVGEPTVNRALRRLIQQHAFKPAPYPNTRDLLALLREEAGPRHAELIEDLFERITLYDMKARDAVATKRPDGRYEVAFTVEGRKLYADGKGRETEASLDEAFDVGVFAAEPGRKEFTTESVLAFERRPLKSGRQTVTLVVDREPKFVGVDPYNKRIDRNSDDNLARVEAR